ncbi:MAG: hypothetical protein K2N87_00490 [Eubacterium sp.]|nr:hypothetical protein [Eubacterium sp.]
MIFHEKMSQASNPYGDGTASRKIADVLEAVCCFVTIHGLGPLIVTIRGDIESLLRKIAPHF